MYRTTLLRKDFLQSPSLSSFTVSLHESDLERVLATAVLINNYPKKVIVLGCEPKQLSLGLSLSGEARNAATKIIDLILREIG